MTLEKSKTIASKKKAQEQFRKGEKVKGGNANAEAPNINWKDMDVHGLISLHGKMEPEFIKNDKKQDKFILKSFIFILKQWRAFFLF